LKALVIPVMGRVREIDLRSDDDDSLSQRQAEVGGWIEAVKIPSFIPDADRATCYVNEEGKLDGLPVNHRATDFMVPGIGLWWGDYIAGPMVVCGFDYETGTNAPIPPGVERRVRLVETEAG
jgi:hypothetical protein